MKKPSVPHLQTGRFFAAARDEPPARGWRWLAFALSFALPFGAGFTTLRQALRIRHGLEKGRSLSSGVRTFDVHPPRARARVLLLGDSTGVGIGCLHGAQTLAGLMASEFPDTEIVNRCRNGARLADAIDQTEQLLQQPGERFDLVLLFVGGNDVLRLSPVPRARAQARHLLARVSRLARRSVWMGSANIGGSPLLIAPFSWLMSWRTGQTMRMLANEAQAFGVEFIDFVRYGRKDIFACHAEIYFAIDGMHPSAASYRHCYEVLKQRVPLAAILTRRPIGVNCGRNCTTFAAEGTARDGTQTSR